MRYIDSGNRDPSQALGTWLNQVLQPDVTEVRWQSGFFVADGLGFLQGTLQRLARENGIVRAVIGSNDQCTSREDIATLVTLMGLPRSRADLGIVSYAGAYFHPKTVHVRRSDGTQAAYAGSANLTESGVGSLHVEAGVTIDSREGDSTQILDEIGAAVDQWFQAGSEGLYRISAPEDIDALVVQGIIGQAPPVIPPRFAATGQSLRSSPRLTRLRPLIRIPAVQRVHSSILDIPYAEFRQVLLPATPRAGFPDYLLFAPNQTTPTEGVTALSGSSLQSGTGLIIRLSLDTSRIFAGGGGTANITIPVATLGTLRFGVQGKGDYPQRPRAEFSLRRRYISVDRLISVSPSRTNIMAYGFMPGEAGHGDVRMLVPAMVKRLAQAVQEAGLPLPQAGHVAFLEWPTMNEEAEFRLSFLDPRTDLFHQAQGLLSQALSSRSIVGEGACWLPNELSPPWII